MAKTFMRETVEVSYWDGTNSFVLPPMVLGDVKFTDKDDTVTIETQGGKFKYPAGKPDGEVAVEVYLPTATYLGPMFGSSYTVATDSNGGQLVNKVAQCVGSTTGVLHIHPVCNSDDRDDYHFYSVTPVIDREITFNTKGDAQKETVKFMVNADETGQRYMIGRSSTTQAKKYVPATNTWTTVA